MNILFLTLSRISDISERGIYTDLIREFSRRGHKSYIVSPTERRFHQQGEVIDSHGVKILKVKTLNIQKTNIIEKGIGTLLLEHQYISAIKRHWNDINFDLVLYSTPPITFNKVIEWQKKKGAKTYLLLKDIFPQNAVDLGMMKKGGIIWRMFRKKEKKLYQLSDFIGCMSPANCQYMINNNSEIDKNIVEVCPNSIEICNSYPAKDLTIKEKYNISNNIPLFIYGGNLGKPQGIDFLIEILNECKNRNDFSICIVGSGTEGEKLHQWYEKQKPTNIKVLKQLPKSDYDQLVASADVGMIFLDKRFTIPNFPSRLLSYLEASLPVLLATDVNTDIGKIAEQNEFGLWSESGDLKNFMKNLNLLIANKELREIMGKNGRSHLIENYTVENSANIILNHF